MRRFVWAVLLLTSGLASAAPDAQVSEPVRWRILVRTPKHPVFNEAFQQQLARELKAALQPGLGLLGTVEVTDTATATDDTAKSFHAKGWPALESSPTRPLDGHKIHGLNIEIADGAYVLTARQLDGFTGLNSPLLRTRTVRSLDLIPRAAGLLIEPDFGPVATVEKNGTDPSLVSLIFRGHTLASPENRVKVGDIFAVSLIKEQAKTQSGTSVPFTYLRVIEPVQGGHCQCRVLTRWANAFGRESARAVAIRAMKLTTIQSNLKVQLVDRAGKPHARGSLLIITASDIDFNAKPTSSDGFEWRDGLYRSTRAFSNIACFSLSIGGAPAQLFPVPILSDQPIALSFNIDAKAEQAALFLRDCTDLRARIADLSTAQLAMVASMNTMLDTARNRDALSRAESGKENIAAAEKMLDEELKHLTSQPGASDTTAKDVLESCARQLVVIREGQTALVKTIESLKTVLATAGSPAALEKEFRINELVERIKTNLARGDVPEALQAYDALIALQPNQASLKDDREKLRAEWTPKDEAHRIARESIRTLANAKAADDFQAACVAIKKAVPVLKQKGDKLGLRKLANTFEPAIAAYYTILHHSDQQPGGAEKTELLSKLNDTLTELRQCESLVRLTLKELAAEPKK